MHAPMNNNKTVVNGAFEESEMSPIDSQAASSMLVLMRSKSSHHSSIGDAAPTHFKTVAELVELVAMYLPLDKRIRGAGSVSNKWRNAILWDTLHTDWMTATQCSRDFSFKELERQQDIGKILCQPLGNRRSWYRGPRVSSWVWSLVHVLYWFVLLSFLILGCLTDDPLSRGWSFFASQLLAMPILFLVLGFSTCGTGGPPHGPEVIGLYLVMFIVNMFAFLGIVYGVDAAALRLDTNGLKIIRAELDLTSEVVTNTSSTATATASQQYRVCKDSSVDPHALIKFEHYDNWTTSEVVITNIHIVQLTLNNGRNVSIVNSNQSINQSTATTTTSCEAPVLYANFLYRYETSAAREDWNNSAAEGGYIYCGLRSFFYRAEEGSNKQVEPTEYREAAAAAAGGSSGSSSPVVARHPLCNRIVDLDLVTTEFSIAMYVVCGAILALTFSISTTFVIVGIVQRSSITASHAAVWKLKRRKAEWTGDPKHNDRRVVKRHVGLGVYVEE